MANDDRKDEGAAEEQAEKTDAGAEATSGMDGKPKGESHKYRSAYGGEGGKPKKPNDSPKGK